MEAKLSSLSWQRVHYTPISIKSRLLLIIFILQHKLLSLDSPSRDCHLLLGWYGHLSGFSLGRPTCRVGRRTPTRCQPPPVLWSWRTPGCAGGGAGDGPCWAQLAFPVVPDVDIISSGALLVHWDDRCQLFLALFLGRIVFGFPRYMKNSCTTDFQNTLYSIIFGHLQMRHSVAHPVCGTGEIVLDSIQQWYFYVLGSLLASVCNFYLNPNFSVQNQTRSEVDGQYVLLPWLQWGLFSSSSTEEISMEILPLPPWKKCLNVSQKLGTWISISLTLTDAHWR